VLTTRIVVFTKATNSFALRTYGQYICSYFRSFNYAEKLYAINYARINTK